jgi:hypothetical protein
VVEIIKHNVQVINCIINSSLHMCFLMSNRFVGLVVTSVRNFMASHCVFDIDCKSFIHSILLEWYKSFSIIQAIPTRLICRS